MGAWFHRWVYTDIYIPLWPNVMAAMLGWAFGAVFIEHRIKTHLRTHLHALEQRLK